MAAITVEFLLSGGTTGAGNTDPDVSLGGVITSSPETEVSSTAGNNLFSKVLNAEALAGSTKYRCIFIKNSSGSDYTGVGVWISTETLSNDSKVYLAVADEGINETVQFPTGITNEGTAPDGDLTFTHPTQSYAMLDLPDLSNGDYVGLWVMRVIDPEASGYDNDYCRLTVEGTAA